ncbi:Nitroreductase-like protein [Venturia nashicola]|nr:Nitroreductase-like protein [Venturia nashicola]
MASSKSFADADQERTSYFQLNKESPISDNKLRKLEITKEASKPKVLDADEFATTVKKLDGFKTGYGTAELQAEGFGCDLQHYRPSSSVVWQRALEEWGIPLTWTLKGQLVFGVKAGEPGEK